MSLERVIMVIIFFLKFKLKNAKNFSSPTLKIHHIHKTHNKTYTVPHTSTNNNNCKDIEDMNRPKNRG